MNTGEMKSPVVYSDVYADVYSMSASVTESDCGRGWRLRILAALGDDLVVDPAGMLESGCGIGDFG